ncbi:hypothetical protein LOK49_LG12G00636, partial [Camellia lanceoleosa]
LLLEALLFLLYKRQARLHGIIMGFTALNSSLFTPILRTIIFLINNGGYTIEVEIHDGPYNVIKNWKYTGL